MKIQHIPRDLMRYLRLVISIPKLVQLQHEALQQGQTLMRSTSLSCLNLPVLAETTDSSRIQLPPNGQTPLHNPSIVRMDDGSFLCLARCTNLITFAENHYFRDEPAHSTINHVFILDESLQIRSRTVLDDSAIRHPKSPAEAGVEDCRLFKHQGAIWGIGAAVSLNENGCHGNATQVLFRLDGPRIVEHHFGPTPNGNWEKNWTPVERDGPMRILYQLSPPIEMELSEQGMEFVSGPPTQNNDWTLRGGTPLVAFGEHFLGIAHSAPRSIDNRVCYLHCLVVFDRSLRHIETSQWFFLRRRGLEFACGLQLHGDMAYIAYGVADRAAEIMRVPISALKRWLVADHY